MLTRKYIRSVFLSSSSSNINFSWTATQPAGIEGVITSGTDSIPIQNLINLTNVPITVTYEAYASTNDLNACQGLAYFYSVTVNPKPNLINEDILLCSEQTYIFHPLMVFLMLLLLYHPIQIITG